MNDNNAIVVNTDNHPLMLALNSPAIVKKFEMACGQQAGSVMINIINAANMNPQIWDCEPQTVITAALNISAMGLSLAPGIGQACILPFNKNKKIGNDWITEKRAQAVIMLRGVKALAMRTNKYRVLNAFPVYFGQEWIEDQRSGIGKPEGPIKDKKQIIGYGAYLQLYNGYEATVYKTHDEILAHAQQYSPTYDKKAGVFKNGSRWLTHFDEQALKTVMKDLIMNHGEISEKDRAALDTVENAATEAGSDWETVKDEEIEHSDIVESVEISDEEKSYINACTFQVSKGEKLVDINTLDDKDLQYLATNGKNEAKKIAAQVILDWRAAHPQKSADDISKELGF